MMVDEDDDNNDFWKLDDDCVAKRQHFVIMYTSRTKITPTIRVYAQEKLSFLYGQGIVTGEYGITNTVALVCTVEFIHTFSIRPGRYYGQIRYHQLGSVGMYS